MICQETGPIPVVGGIHVSREALELAQEIEPFIDILKKKHSGNGKIMITVEMAGGRIRKFFDFAGKLFH